MKRNGSARTVGSSSVMTGDMRSKQQRKDGPSWFKQLILTILLLGSLTAIAYGFVELIRHVMDTEWASQVREWVVKLPETIADMLQSVIDTIGSFQITLWPPSQWFDTDQVDWNAFLKFEVGLFSVGVAALVMDLLFSSEAKQGSPIILLPSFIFALLYCVSRIHSAVSRQEDIQVMKSLDAGRVGAEVFSSPQTVAGLFLHRFAFDLALAYAMTRDFYTRITSRRKLLRLLMVGVVLGTCALNLCMVPVYFLLRKTIFAGPQIVKPRPLNTNKNSYRRELEDLLDPIPEGSGALTGWVRHIPVPFNVPIVIVVVAVGIVRFFAMLAFYIFYMTFICLPISAIFFSLRRSWLLYRGRDVNGAVYGVFDPVDGKKFPFKAVLVITGHLRLICFKNNNIIFNLLFGWWLRPLLSAFVMYEFTVPFKTNFAPYCAFLMEEFGTVFPMGAGLGFGAYADVKHIMENKNLRKGGLSLAWSISDAQNNWSANNLTTHPQAEIDVALVAEGRELVRCWLQKVSTELNKLPVQKRLNAILPFANVDGKPVDQKLVEISFGSTLFHLLTGGEFTETERKHYHKLLTNAFPFLSDFINKIWFGGVLEYLGIQDYGTYNYHPGRVVTH